jgi:hypothetical protein
MTVIRVKMRGQHNAAVKTDTGIQVRVPIELGVVGTELDENRLHYVPSAKGWVYLSLNSTTYKKRCIDYSTVSKEQWEVFYNIVSACFKKFVQKRWIRPSEFKELYWDFLAKSSDSGVPYRMWQRPGVDPAGYIYAHVKGYLQDRLRKRKKERELNLVSFEELERLQVL